MAADSGGAREHFEVQLSTQWIPDLQGLGVFLLSRQDLDRGFAAHNRSFATKKNPVAPRVALSSRSSRNFPAKFRKIRCCSCDCPWMNLGHR